MSVYNQSESSSSRSHPTEISHDQETVMMDPTASDSDESYPSDVEEEADPISLEVVQELEASTEFDPHDFSDTERVVVSKEDAEEIRVEIWKDGVVRFLKRLMYGLPAKFSSSQVLSALGFPLKKLFVTKVGEQFLALYVHAAIRYTMKARQKLQNPKNLDEFCQALEKASNVLVLTGAGISTSLGIPDFRSSTGLYSRLANLGIGDPQEVFSMSLFREDPSIFYTVAKDILPEHTKFSPTHRFIRLLYEKGKLLRNYTQNIDNLEEYAGIPAEKLVQCHGSFATATCVSCGFKTQGETLFEDIRKAQVPQCPICEKERLSSKRKRKDDDDENDYVTDLSEGVMKPDITFFGEALPDRFDKMLFGKGGEIGDARACDLLICIGTSLQVAPVADIIRVVPPDVPQIYISKTVSRKNVFDVTFLGNCDDVVELIEEKMGWKCEHEMHRRQEITDKSPRDACFPNGDIVYDEASRTYKFIDPNAESEPQSDDESGPEETRSLPQEPTTESNSEYRRASSLPADVFPTRFNEGETPASNEQSGYADSTALNGYYESFLPTPTYSP